MSQYQYQQYHLFSLPPELLDTLVPRNLLTQVPDPSPPPQTESSAPPENHASGSRACNICLGAIFSDVQDQRLHFRSDWHRYNVKVRLNGADPLTEQHFAQLLDGLEDSISGSASSSSEEDSSDESDAVAALVQRTRKLARPSFSDDNQRTVPQIPLVWFHSPPATQIGVYRTIFSTSTSPSDYLSELKQMQSGGDSGRSWALFMTAGGHFAGAIVRVKRPDGDNEEGPIKKGKPKRPKPELEILKHKTFHRYTTRRKQGGSQSLNDNAKSKAVSAGAMLRRYGEQALRDDIRNLLADWAEDIYDCERIFIRASVSNRRIFLDYEGAVIEKGDERLRGFPFPTRRPTQSELTRCLQELIRVKVSHLTEDALRAQDEALLASLPKPKAQPTPQPEPTKQKDKPAVPQLSPEEELFRDKWARLLDMVKRGRLDALKPFWAREASALGGVNVLVPEWATESGCTLLQVAARANQIEMTQWLLEDLHADPTIAVPSLVPGSSAAAGEDSGIESDASDAPRLPRGGAGRRTAYDLARTKEVRNVFRRAAAAHPDWWDWLGNEHGARVPSVLTVEMEEGREGKKKARRKGLKDKVKERETRERQVAAPAPPPPPVQEARRYQPQDNASGPRKLGGSTGGAESVAGLTPEMRAKIERERRARAAEARLKALGGGR